jgi:uncharacterized membrane protein YgdD (TMEM256/DUF423 family)
MNFVTKPFMIAGAVLGLTGVVLGAMGAHALKPVLTPDQLASYETAVRFQLYHAFFLLIVALLPLVVAAPRLLKWAGWLACAGSLCFSGSIYLITLTPVRGAFVFVTPLGGLLLMAAWTCVVFAAFSAPTKQ